MNKHVVCFCSYCILVYEQTCVFIFAHVVYEQI